jgi:argininosuccinate lyase
MAQRPSTAPKSAKVPASGGKPWETAKSGAGSASDPLATRFVESLSYDRRLYKHDIAGSLAHARMLAKVGLITADECRQIEGGLAAIQAEIDAEGEQWGGWNQELEDLHMCLEAALIEKIDEPGRKLHTGRSRNDQVALDLKLWVEDAATDIEHALEDLAFAFVELARRDGRIVMPGYTHLQRAQPIVVGGELLAWASIFDRAGRRLTAVRTLIPRNPLGSGALAGSSLPLDRQAVADALPALGDPTPNSIDATSNRETALDMTYCLAIAAMNLSRWAEQWVLYNTSEFGFIHLDDRYTTGSSMMPQKRNPDMLELIRGRTGGVYGNLFALLTMCKGLPLGYNRDLQEDKRQVFAAYDCVRDCLVMARRIVLTTRFNSERIEAGLDRGFLDATSLAEYLVTRGVAFRTAHQIVGGLVRTCEQRGLHALAQLALGDLQAACSAAGYPGDTCGADAFSWLGAARVVARYQTFGNAGLTGFEQQMQAWETRLAEVSRAPSSV